MANTAKPKNYAVLYWNDHCERSGAFFTKLLKLSICLKTKYFLNA